MPSVEWSGIIFYKVEGDITDPDTFVITPQEILPLDRGTAGATKYQIGMPAVNFMEKHEASENGWIIGHIHSHNNMGVFFSGTDDNELRTNAPNHNFYFSIIVNNKDEITAKVAVYTKLENEEKIKDIGYVGTNKSGEKYRIFQEKFDIPKECINLYECDLIRESNSEISDEFVELTDVIDPPRQSYTGSRYSRENSDYIPLYQRENQMDDDLEDGSYGSIRTVPANYDRADKNKEKVVITKLRAEEVLPRLLLFDEPGVDWNDIDTVEDAIDLLVLNETGFENQAKYVARHWNKFADETFIGGATSAPIYALRCMIEAIESKMDDYESSKKLYHDGLEEFKVTLTALKKEKEGPKKQHPNYD